MDPYLKVYRSNNKWIINFKAGLLCIKEIFELLSITYINERWQFLN